MKIIEENINEILQLLEDNADELLTTAMIMKNKKLVRLAVLCGADTVSHNIILWAAKNDEAGILSKSLDSINISANYIDGLLKLSLTCNSIKVIQFLLDNKIEVRVSDYDAMRTFLKGLAPLNLSSQHDIKQHLMMRGLILRIPTLDFINQLRADPELTANAEISRALNDRAKALEATAEEKNKNKKS